MEQHLKRTGLLSIATKESAMRGPQLKRDEPKTRYVQTRHHNTLPPSLAHLRRASQLEAVVEQGHLCGLARHHGLLQRRALLVLHETPLRYALLIQASYQLATYKIKCTLRSPIETAYQYGILKIYHGDP